MASSSSSQYVAQEVGLEYLYPYPSNLSATSFISVKLSGRDEYDMWKTQMQCLLKSHGMYGFINGTLISPKTSSSTSGKAKVGDYQSHSLWTRSDAVVKGWILGSLSKQTLGYVLDRVTRKLQDERNVDDFSAKDVWDILQTIYGPSVVPLQQQLMYHAPVPLQQQPMYLDLVPLQQNPMYLGLPVPDQRQYYTYEGLDLNKRSDEYTARARKTLYRAILGEEWLPVEIALVEITIIDKITDNGNTALHVAVSNTKNPEFIEKLLGLVPENTRLRGLRNSDGSTLLHVAAIVGNTAVAKILVERYPDLLFVKDNKCHTPLALALSNMHTKTSELLLKHVITDVESNNDLFSGTSGDDLQVTAICSKIFGLANDLMERCKALHSDTVLMAVAQNFPWELSTLEKYLGIQVIIILPFMILRILVWPFIGERTKNHDDAARLLTSLLYKIMASSNPASYHRYYTNVVFEATRRNSYEFVQEVVSIFPDAIWRTNEDGHDIIQYAVITRSENVYNLLYQMSEHKNVYRTTRDSCGNNLLHLAARLSPVDFCSCLLYITRTS